MALPIRLVASLAFAVPLLGQGPCNSARSYRDVLGRMDHAGSPDSLHLMHGQGPHAVVKWGRADSTSVAILPFEDVGDIQRLSSTQALVSGVSNGASSAGSATNRATNRLTGYVVRLELDPSAGIMVRETSVLPGVDPLALAWADGQPFLMVCDFASSTLLCAPFAPSIDPAVAVLPAVASYTTALTGRECPHLAGDSSHLWFSEGSLLITQGKWSDPYEIQHLQGVWTVQPFRPGRSQGPQAPEPALAPLAQGAIHLDGWLGARVESNRTQWLDRVDLEPRLRPFTHRPAEQAWAGEHLGKWLHASSLAWQQSGDAALKARLDRAVDALLATQEDDGYLGAYLPGQRFQLLPGADWDVWTIKYTLLGLPAYHEATGEARSLAAARRAADQLLATFPPGGRSILSAGTHVGMAATSVLEPIVELFRITRDERYLAFARQLVAAWDEPGGPRIAAALREHGRVARTANGKAYEMLSNLVGLCALYEVTGERAYLEPVFAAWQDIEQNELLPTGSMSVHEHFTGGGRLPAAMSANLGETCVTVTWLQLNLHLLQITGEARFGAEIERSACNHLAAAQRPDGAQWCYYTSLLGKKPYDPGITCCSSSGGRGMALLPQTAVFVAKDGALVINLLEAAHGTAVLGDKPVQFTLQSELPRTGSWTLTFAGETATFPLRLRLSDWALPATLRIGGEERTLTQPGWCEIPARTWAPGESLQGTVCCRLTRLTDQNDPDRAAFQWGPCVLALAEPAVAGGGTRDRLVAGFVPPRLLPGPLVRIACEWKDPLRAVPVEMSAFADIGADGAAYRVWFATPGPDGAAVTGEARSRDGNVPGAIADGDRDTFVVTYDGAAAPEDWYSITLAESRTVREVTFAHGHAFHDGGWFDAAVSKPRVQVRSTASGEWRTVGELGEYPSTTSSDPKGLRDGQLFTLRFAEPVVAVEVRVVGVPASGDRAKPGGAQAIAAQAFSSCAELFVR
jgi:uncharacterized protein